MYNVTAPAVYMHETVAANEVYRQRVNRVVAALKKPVTPVVQSQVDNGLVKPVVRLSPILTFKA